MEIEKCSTSFIITDSNQEKNDKDLVSVLIQFETVLSLVILKLKAKVEFRSSGILTGMILNIETTTHFCRCKWY